MTHSKRSLNYFANQYNVAVATKALYFKVENTTMNRKILNLFYKEGLINSYTFRQEDVYIADKNIQKQIYSYTHRVHRYIDPKLYFSDLLSLTTVNRAILPTLVVNDNAQKPADLFFETSLSREKLKDFELIFFIHKILHLFYTLKDKMDSRQIVMVYNRLYSFRFEFSSTMFFGKEILWDNILTSILELKQLHDLRNRMHMPRRFIFVPEFEGVFLSYLSFLLKVDIPFEEPKLLTRAEMQINFFQDHWWYQDTLFEDDRILVYPRYYSGKAVLKKITTCGGTVVSKYVSLDELNLLKQSKGYTTLYILSTTNGLVLDSMSNLLINEGGLLMLELKI